MQEFGEKEMDKKMAKKPTDQNFFHGSNKYKMVARGYSSVLFVYVLFPAEMWPTWGNS